MNQTKKKNKINKQKNKKKINVIRPYEPKKKKKNIIKTLLKNTWRSMRSKGS